MLQHLVELFIWDATVVEVNHSHFFFREVVGKESLEVR